MFIVASLVYLLNSRSTFAVPLHITNYPAFLASASASPRQEDQCTCFDQRSIWDIVWSCLVTIFACSWVSVHPNIPGRGESKAKIALRRLELMFWAIIAPELIIYWAMRQWFGARRIAHQYKEFGWSKTHGYFLQMGGFVLYDGTKAQQVLAADNIGDLYETGKIDFPRVSEEEIQDRSKADALSKTLVVVQTIWFITQCIARRVQGLIITELELVTVAFAFLNALIYFLWWNKPLDVHIPIPVYLLDPKEQHFTEAREDQASINPSGDEMDSESDTSQSEDDEDDNDDRDQATYFSERVKLRQGCGITIELSSATLKYIWVTAYKVFKEILKTFAAMFFILLYVPAAIFASILGRMAEMTLQSNDISIDQVNLRVPTFYSSAIIGRAENQIICASSFMAILFGSIHCVGWTFAFRTHVEQLLWQISSATITIIPFCMLVPSAIYILQKNTYPLLMEVVDRQWGLVGLILLLLPLPFYIGARFILLIEACMGLRSLSPGALAVIVWTNFVPHI